MGGEETELQKLLSLIQFEGNFQKESIPRKNESLDKAKTKTFRSLHYHKIMHIVNRCTLDLVFSMHGLGKERVIYYQMGVGRGSDTFSLES